MSEHTNGEQGSETPGPYEGVRVLELAEGISGPFAGRWLAALGADVVKVERTTGDPSRAFGPWPDDLPDDETSGLFLYLNGDKRSVTLNLETSDGREILRELAESAEIVIESFEPGYLAERGLGYEELSKDNSALVMVSITPFGQTGPNANLPATELTLYAASGQMWLTGHPARTPLKNGGSQPSYQAGLNAFAAVSSAYYGAVMHEQGSHIDLSMQETYAAMAEAFHNRASQLGIETQRGGNFLNALWGIYELADGYGGICALPRNYPGFARAVGLPELQDERFSDPGNRLINNDELMAIMYGWFSGQTRQGLMELGIEHRVPFGFVATFEDLANSEHLHNRRFFAQRDDERAGPLTYPGRLWLSNEHEWKMGAAPTLGQHNVEIIHGELGYEREDLVRLRELDAI
ncbi:MAG: CoA transferase [Chloroflexi bacterium]|nr:CoA transferase [Chloroflexota bacterium]